VETQGSLQAPHPPEPRNPSSNPLPHGEGASVPQLPLPLREGAGGRDQALPRLNLAGDSMTNALASGAAVLPAWVDARWRNREPAYPPDAARRREAGAVVLLVHVDPDGAVAGIDVVDSSGFFWLDQAARMAVGTWHFLPAVHEGQPVASDMPLRVVFQLN
jgi:TonB family protein